MLLQELGIRVWSWIPISGESQKAESVDSARERSQLRQPRSNNVPSDSQQTDRWQDMFL